MASQFKNSNLGYYLYAAIVVIIGAASLFVFWYMITGFNIGKYDENTIIGSVYIGGLTEEEAEDKLRGRIEDWLEDERVLFEARYQGYSYEFDRELIFFDIDQSLADIQDGSTNTLYVSYSETALAEVFTEFDNEPWMETMQDQFDLEALIDDILNDAAGMKTFSSKQLNHYVIEESSFIDVLYIGNLSVPDTLQSQALDADELMDKINNQFPEGLTIEPKSFFSVLDTFDESFTRAELSYISSLLLEIIPETPFNIHERDYFIDQSLSNYNQPSYTFYGRNSVVQRNYGIDFSFENNTYCTFYITFDTANDFFNVTLSGAPILDDISVEREIVHFDYETVETTDPDEVRAGTEGVIVLVNRTITNIYNDVLADDLIIYEYYPAIDEIVLE
ncbi:MAG: hypothetical protein ACOC1L_06960 [Bacillota bacterium]